MDAGTWRKLMLGEGLLPRRSSTGREPAARAHLVTAGAQGARPRLLQSPAAGAGARLRSSGVYDHVRLRCRERHSDLPGGSFDRECPRRFVVPDCVDDNAEARKVCLGPTSLKGDRRLYGHVDHAEQAVRSRRLSRAGRRVVRGRNFLCGSGRAQRRSSSAILRGARLPRVFERRLWRVPLGSAGVFPACWLNRGPGFCEGGMEEWPHSAPGNEGGR